MRISRTLQLAEESSSIHMFWRCHNREFYLNSYKNKKLYMSCMLESMLKKNYNNVVKIFSYCVMGNHYHQSAKYLGGSSNLSNYMRSAHSLFGARYNLFHSRSGKVAESRPKTTLIEDEYHEMKVHFYVEANPIRAGLCKFESLQSYKYCSYKYFAFGIRDEFTELLTEPEWYLKLGKTSKERQKEYRKLFREYLDLSLDKLEYKKIYKTLFYGSAFWQGSHLVRIKYKLKNNSS